MAWRSAFLLRSSDPVKEFRARYASFACDSVAREVRMQVPHPPAWLAVRE
jgi:hypothetical protein